MFKEKMKNLLEKGTEGGNNKKKIENLVVFLIIVIITIIAINSIWKGDKKEVKQESSNTDKVLASKEITQENTGYNLEQKLEQILSKINGVGDVRVLITYSESDKTIPMYNENLKQSATEESDTGGGNRKITETDSSKEIIYKEENGQKIPITEKIVMATIEGAIITAKGAGNAVVKSNIIQAVEAATGVPTHKIQVFQMN